MSNNDYVKFIPKPQFDAMKKVYEKNKRISITRLAESVAVSKKKARTFLRDMKHTGKKNIVGVVKEANGITRDQAKEMYDPELKTRKAIRIGISKLRSPMMYDDNEFKNLCGNAIVKSFFRSIAEEEEFLKYQVWIPGSKNKILWCDPDDVKWAEDNISGAIGLYNRNE